MDAKVNARINTPIAERSTAWAFGQAHFSLGMLMAAGLDNTRSSRQQSALWINDGNTAKEYEDKARWA